MLRSGDCFITFEFAGGSPGYDASPLVPLAPFEVFSESVIRTCVQGERGTVSGLGGFSTMMFQNILDWSQVGAFETSGWYHPPPVRVVFFTSMFPISISFLNPYLINSQVTNIFTVTVSGTRRLFNPGNNDPAVPARLADLPPSTATLKNPNAPSQEMRHRFWTARSERMSRGGTYTWWGPPAGYTSSMAYECDSQLGAPTTVDCTHIQWDELGPPSDSITVSPGTVRFLHSSKQRKQHVLA